MLPVESYSGNNTKKSRIRQLLDKGSYTEADIARLVGTTLDNVRKEKSIYSKETGKKITLSHESTAVEKSSAGAVVSRTERMSIELERDLLSVPPLDAEQLRVAYGYFYDGKLPGEVVKDKGFHPLAVEIEFERFIRTDKRVPQQVAIKIFDCALDKNSIKELKEKFEATGVLTFEELEALMAGIQFEPTMNRFKEYLCSHLVMPSLPLPECCSRPVCMYCGTLVEGIIYSSAELIRIQFTTPSTFLCTKCIKSYQKSDICSNTFRGITEKSFHMSE
jgi:hypothetical protein